MPVRESREVPTPFDDILLPPLPKEPRGYGVYVRAHPVFPDRLIVEVWDGFERCLTISAPLACTWNQNTELAFWAWLEQVNEEYLKSRLAT